MDPAAGRRLRVAGDDPFEDLAETAVVGELAELLPDAIEDGAALELPHLQAARDGPADDPETAPAVLIPAGHLVRCRSLVLVLRPGVGVGSLAAVLLRRQDAETDGEGLGGGVEQRGHGRSLRSIGTIRTGMPTRVSFSATASARWASPGRA